MANEFNQFFTSVGKTTLDTVPSLGTIHVWQCWVLRNWKSHRLSDFKLSLLGKELMPSESIRDLRVTIDPTLSFNKHISVTVSSCMSRLAQMSWAKHALNFDLLVIIINALVFSKLYYCSSVWSNTSASNMQKLQLVQNFAARIISGATKFEHITPSLKNMGWLPVKKQVYLRDAIFAFKCMTGCAPTYLMSQCAIGRQISDRITRNSQQLNIPLFKTATGRRSFHYRIVNLWNSLDKDLKLCEDFANFKKTLKFRMLNEFLKQKKF